MAVKKEKPRRRRGEGSVLWVAEKKKWRAYITDPNGKKLTAYFEDEQDGDDWITLKKAEFIKKEYIAPSDMTLGEWVIFYLETFVKSKVATKTYESYLSDARYLAPVDSIPLQQIDAEDMQDVINDLNKAGFSASTQKKAMNLLKAALKFAVMQRVLPYSSAVYLTAPSVEQREVVIFTPEEIALLKEAAKGHQWEHALTIWAVTGLRPSELYALQAEDLNFTTNELSISRKVVQTKAKGLEVGSPKTKRSKRKMSLPAETMAELEIYKDKTGWLFQNSVGGVVDPSKFYKWYKKLFKATGVAYRSPNTFRHTHATLLLQNNSPLLDVSGRLGHARTSTTVDRYGQYVPGQDKAIAVKAGEVITPKKGANQGAKPIEKVQNNAKIPEIFSKGIH